MTSRHEQRQNHRRYRVWLEQASWDLKAAQVSLDNGFYEWATFQCQQSAEKAMKAILVHAGWKAPRIHKLSVLYNQCRRANENFRRIYLEYRDLEAYTFWARYPFLVPGEDSSPHSFITLEDAQTCLAQSQSIYAKINRLLTD